MAQFLAPIINDQQEDSNGAPLSGGTIGVYLAGTSTPAATFSDKAGLVPNTWPISLNTLGVNSQGAVWLTGGQAYKYVITSSLGIVQRTIDNVSGINDSSTSVDQWVAFAGTPTFVSATSFTVPGDQTQTFAFGARVKTVNTSGIVYGTVARSVYTSLTTVTIVPDGGSLDSGLSSVSVGLITPVSPSLPGTLTTPPFRNRILNAAMRIDQRNNGASLAIVAAAPIAYCIDRFYASCTGANVAVQRVAGTGYQNAVTITGLAANTATLFGQRIESTNCYDWASQQVNVQIPISANGIASVTWNAYVANATDNFAAKTLLATGTLALTGAVETKFFSFNAGANATRGVAIEFVTGPLLAGQSITYQGAMQAEVGQLSPFEKVEIGVDFQQCRRYYQLVFNGARFIATAPGQATSTMSNLPVVMRATPTAATFTAGSAVNAAAFTYVSVSARGFRCELTATAAGDAYVVDNTTAVVVEL